MKTKTRDSLEKLEAIVRADVENMPYKYRDLRYMFYEGVTPYRDLSEEEINETFKEMELKVTKEDREWVDYELGINKQ